jgi:subtilisin family serine protease
MSDLCVSRRFIWSGVLLVAWGLLPALPSLANSNAADTTNAEDLWAGGSLGYNLTGAGVTVGVWEARDSGNWEIRDTHEAFTYGLPAGQSRVSFGDTKGSGYSDHATHVAGIIGGAHIPGQRASWGMAPGVNLVSWDSFSDDSEMRNESPTTDITNHSYASFNSTSWLDITWDVSDGNGGTVRKEYRTWFYGTNTYFRDQYDENPTFGKYTDIDRDIDRVLNDRPKLLTFISAGNHRSYNKYSDYQKDGKYVARFSQDYIDNVGVIGEALSHSFYTGHYLVHKDDYGLPGYDGVNGGGYDSMIPLTMAKNAVIVGAVNDHTQDPQAGGSILTTGFTSYGPTDDGRLGVDLVANGEQVYSARDSSDTAYGNKNGTSMSSPNAAGSAALILEHWRNRTGGTPDSATQKGLLMHTAADSTRDKQVGPDYRTGYGLLDAKAAVLHIDEAITQPTATRQDHIFTDTLNQGESISFDFLAIGGELKASLSWLDPASENWADTDDYDNRTPDLVNDLDVWWTNADGDIFFPWTLDPENPKNAAVRDKHNRVDNFTQAMIDSVAASSVMTLHVSHYGSLLNGSQDFSLFVSGGTLIPEPGVSLVLTVSLVLVAGRRRRSHRTM